MMKKNEYSRKQRKRMNHIKTFAILLLFITVAHGRQRHLNDSYHPNTPEKIITAFRVDENPIRIDGKITEPIWQLAPEGNDFIQRNPDEGKPATEYTTFRILYDDRNLYVCVNAIDSKPDEIKGILTRRDEDSPSDWISISIDSYNDKRTAFEFWLNPLGVKKDLYRFDDVNDDDNWDPIWYGAAHINPSGWTAEFKIPFKELRFSNEDNQIWGFQAYRHISRNNEDIYWKHIPKEESGWVSRYGKIAGISSIPRQKRIYITPYTNGNSIISKDLINEIHPNKYDLNSNLGADVKVGLTNNLTLDLTINPDFGQVEADPGELNLTAFETYFSEKRPFFIEGGNIFNFNLGFGDGDLSQNTLFYSRRIGRSPQRNLDDEIEEDTTWAKYPKMTTILGAGKVTGKTENGWSIGLLSALTAEEHGEFIYSSRRTDNVTVEPLSSYSITRIQKDYRNGQTNIGGILTSTLRNIKDKNLEFLRDRAFTGGIDLSHQFFNRHYAIEAAAAFSNVHGTREAIRETQESPLRYYQRPDAKHVSLDTNRTSLSGFSNKLILWKIAGGHWRWGFGGMATSPGFEVNDLGYMRDVDQTIQFIWVGYREFQPGKIFRNYGINFNQWTAWNFEKTSLGTGGNINSWLEFLNYWEFNFGINIQSVRISTNSLRGGPSIKVPGGFNFWTGFETDERKILSFSIGGFSHSQNDGSSGYNISPSIAFRPSQNIKVSLHQTFMKNQDLWAWVSCEEDNFGNNHYIFAKLNQKLTSMTLRLDYTITPTLSIQLYAEPFLTAGTYRNYKEVTDPKNKNFNDQFRTFNDDELTYYEDDEYYDVNIDSINYSFGMNDFNYKQYRSNLVIRWEYLPGSVIFLVWSQGFNDWVSDGRFRPGKDINSLFASNAENVFMIKVSYLLNI